MRFQLLSAALVCGTLPAQAALAQPAAAHVVAAAAKPIDFASVPREILVQPAFVSKKPRYGLFLFGLNGEMRVWAILDKSSAGIAEYDVLYLDVNANGDLTEKGEKFSAKAP